MCSVEQKADIYEGGHRIPLIVQWPAAIKAGGSCDRIVCLSDLMATMADVLDVKLPDTCAEDSVSNLPLWKDPEGAEVRKDIVASEHRWFSVYPPWPVQAGTLPGLRRLV